ncbi:hypothetical protein HHK36_029037 [Tetracentron sinense]|uniref:WRKY domain-containing protein n=1 Tax=Tetracentron sinense TaxID=13715 RepID=A0A834YCJ9_TETSI|nr:hypothetical protein HHK36_029037 [Tetracentron sinense]
MEDDWDLQAVVRGCTTATTATSATATATIEDSFSFFAPSSIEQDDHLLSFSDLFETRSDLEELEELYKPFFPKFQPLPQESIPTSSLSVLGGLKELQQQQPPQQQAQKQQPQRSLAASAIAAATTTHSQTPRSKRRKNQQKKVVCQVPAEGLSSDMWAWRKYGQKPIKGSPYPRGYYRCSSSKGCLARKQVERSRSDPSMFILTYTAEHNHPVPTHRNSLAGSTRHKFSTPSRTTGEPDATTSKPSCSSPISTTGFSPTTPLMGSIEDEFVQQSSKQQSREDEEEEMVEEEEEDELLIPDMVMTDDLFMGLEELAGPTSVTGPAFDDRFPDQFPATLPPLWFSNNATTATGGG